MGSGMMLPMCALTAAGRAAVCCQAPQQTLCRCRQSALLCQYRIVELVWDVWKHLEGFFMGKHLGTVFVEVMHLVQLSMRLPRIDRLY